MLYRLLEVMSQCHIAQNEQSTQLEIHSWSTLLFRQLQIEKVSNALAQEEPTMRMP